MDACQGGHPAQPALTGCGACQQHTEDLSYACNGDVGLGLRGLQLPYLYRLLCSHLSAADRLSSFQSSRALATAVLLNARGGHTARAVDMCKDRNRNIAGQAAACTGAYGVTVTLDAQRDQSVSQHQLQARRRALQRLLSTAPSAQLHIELKNGVSGTWAYLPGRQIIKLSLADMHLPADLDTLLPLQQCSSLHTLSISNVCCDPQQEFNVSVLSEQQQAAFHAPFLKHVEVHGEQASNGLAVLAQLLGNQITQLTVRVMHTSVQDAPKQPQPMSCTLPTTTLVMLTHFSTDALIGDQLLDGLASLPRLTHVTAAGMHLDSSHPDIQLQWQQLTLANPVYHMAVDLSGQHVHLQGIQGITIHGYVCIGSLQVAEQLALQLACHRGLRCELDDTLSFNISGYYTAPLVSICANAMTTRGRLVFMGFLRPRPDLLRAIQCLPGSVVALLFYAIRSEQEWPDIEPDKYRQFMRQLAEFLPWQLIQVGFQTPNHTSQACAWASALLAASTTKQSRAKVAVYPYGSAAWDSKPFQQLVQDHSGKVYGYQLDQCGKLGLWRLVFVDGHVKCVPVPVDSTSTASCPSLQGLPLPGPCLSALLCNHLSAADRLALFQTSKGMAAAVLQHARWGATGQKVEAGYGRGKVESGQAATCCSTYGITVKSHPAYEEGARQFRLQARQRAIQLLLSAAPYADLHVVLYKAVPVIWAYLPGRQISKLSLVNMDLPENMATTLPLQQCSNLHTLSIENVRCDQQQLSALSKQQQAAFYGPFLTHMEVQGQLAWSGFQAWAQLLGKQVTHVSIKLNNEVQPGQRTRVSDAYRHLLHVRHPVPSSLVVLSHFSTDGFLTDDLFSGLTALPTLKHVTVAGVALRRSHDSEQFRWQQLCLDGAGSPGVILHAARHLRLQSINHIVVRGGLLVLFDEALALTKQLKFHPHVQCVPTADFAPTYGPPSTNMFRLGCGYTAELVDVCARALTGDTACLTLGFYTRSWGDLLLAICALPSHITSIAFACDSGSLPADSLEEDQYMQQVARELPAQVTSIGFNAPLAVSKACAWAAAALTELTAIKRSTKVFLGVFQPAPSWSEEPLVQLVKAHSGRVYTYQPGHGQSAANKVEKLVHVGGYVQHTHLCAEIRLPDADQGCCGCQAFKLVYVDGQVLHQPVISP